MISARQLFNQLDADADACVLFSWRVIGLARVQFTFSSR